MGRQRATTTQNDVEITATDTSTPGQESPPQDATAAEIPLSAFEQPQGANEDGSYIYHDPAPEPEGGAGEQPPTNEDGSHIYHDPSPSEEAEAGPQIPAGLPEGTHYEDREDGQVLVVPGTQTEAVDEQAADSAEATEETPTG